MKSDARSYFRVVSLVGLAVLLPALVSCMSPSSAGTKVVSYPADKIVKHSRLVAKNLEVTDLRTDVVNGLKKVQITAENVSKKTLQFEFRFKWLDAKQYEVKTPLTTWSSVSVIAKDTVNMLGVAPTAEVTDFEFVVRFPDRL